MKDANSVSKDNEAWDRQRERAIEGAERLIPIFRSERHVVEVGRMLFTHRSAVVPVERVAAFVPRL